MVGLFFINVLWALYFCGIGFMALTLGGMLPALGYFLIALGPTGIIFWLNKRKKAKLASFYAEMRAASGVAPSTGCDDEKG